MVRKKQKTLWIGRYTFCVLSVLWALFVVYGFATFGWIGRLPDLTPAELVVQSCSLLFPVCIFYLLGNYIDRNQLINMEISSTKAYLEELIYPSDLGAKRVQEMNSDLKEQIQLFKTSFLSMSKQTNSVREDLTQWIEDLNKIIVHMDEQTKNMAGYVQQLGQAMTFAQEQSSQAGQNLVDQAEGLLKVTDETQRRLNDVSKQLKTQTEEISQNVHAVAHAEKSIGVALDKSSEWISALSDNSRKIEKAMKTTDTMQGFLADTDKVLMRFKEIGTTMDMRLKALKQTKTNVKEPEIVVTPVSAKEFTERMQQILDKLQGLSVEMMTIFEPKNEEALWDQYYAGDKAVFMRNIKHILSQSKQQKVLDMALINPAFQENVNAYMTTFEDLTRGLENSPWLGVLVGSDPGRLYMVLATLFKGEKHANKVS